MNKEKLYIDIEQFKEGHTIAIEVDELKYDVLSAGKTIVYMPMSDKIEKAYQILADEYDVCHIFEDNIPKFKFYPVPSLKIFASDSIGGCFASTKTIDMTATNVPIYYIDKYLRIYYLSSNLLDFFEMIVFFPLWKTNLGLCSNKLCNTKQGQEYLCHKLNLKNNNFKFNINEQNKDNIIIYPTLNYAKKEIHFYKIKNEMISPF